MTGTVGRRKNPAAVALGRKGGKARLRTMTHEERSKVAQKASRARWFKVRTPDWREETIEVVEVTTFSDGRTRLRGFTGVTLRDGVVMPAEVIREILPDGTTTTSTKLLGPDVKPVDQVTSDTEKSL